MCSAHALIPSNITGKLDGSAKVDWTNSLGVISVGYLKNIIQIYREEGRERGVVV